MHDRRHGEDRTGRAPAAALLALLLVAAAPACSDDGDAASSSTSSTAAPTTTVPALDGMLLDASDLPEGFAATDDADDTVTSFCAAEDAAAGLSASARAVAGFRRDPAGASVVQVVIRFEDDGAATFVSQAGDILQRCDAVPDVSGLAFEYEPLTEDVERELADTESHAGGHGVSVGSGNLTVNIGVFRHGDVGQLVAVLGLDLPRAELDELAAAAFRAAVARAGSG